MLDKEYIEREVVINAISNTDWYSINKDGKLVLGASDGDTALFKARDVFDVLHNAPTADVVEVRHGYWIPYSSTMMECSVCKRHTARHRYEFCPRCGAKMDRK